jgi:hypothetical protein
MDPTECLKQLLLAIADGDKDDTVGYLQDLTEWLQKDGALPDVEQVVLELTEAWFEEGDEDSPEDSDDEPEPAATIPPPARRRTQS